MALRHPTAQLLSYSRSCRYTNTQPSLAQNLPLSADTVHFVPKGMNVLIRFSAAGVRDECRKKLEIGCPPPLDEILATIGRLTCEGLAVSLRIQLVIYEDPALTIANRAALAGAKHISLEYLKMATQEKRQTLDRISAATGENVWDVMTQRGITRIGRDYTLIASAKCEFVRRAKQLCHDSGIRFGAGDTEFIHLSVRLDCCNGSGYFLENCTQFRSNFVGILTRHEQGNQKR